MDRLWGILNPYGDLWTYEVFDGPGRAQAHLVKFWRDFDGSEPKGYRIVPVKVRTSVDLVALSKTLPSPGGSDE